MAKASCAGKVPLLCFHKENRGTRIIFQRLCQRIKHGIWDKSQGFTRQRQSHWLRALKKNIKSYIGLNFGGSVFEGFYELMHTCRIPVLRAG